MPREKQFDIDQALERAMQVFWVSGYEATSMTELLGSMGIGRGSFYDTFGSKHKLFIRVLLRYDDRRKVVFQRISPTTSSLDGVLLPFDYAISEASCGTGGGGCLLVNASLELPRDGAVTSIVDGANRDAIAYFHAAIEAGKRAGEIPASVNALDASRTLLALLLGVRVLTRSAVPEGVLPSIRRQVVDLLT